MKQNWTMEELEELWTLQPDELTLLDNRTKENKLGFALIFKYFQITSFFPKEISDIPKAIIFHIAKQINVASKIAQSYKWNKKSSEAYRPTGCKFSKNKSFCYQRDR
ncbi:MAG: DUF4158 domain-containing protein, partial [Candidatus Paracaedibacter sp.]